MPADRVPHWPMAELLQGLAAAELGLAEFNAHRTSLVEGAAIGRGGSAHFHWLFDRSRPDSAYYNRALARGTGPLPAESLGELPPEVAAVELLPAQLLPPVCAGLMGQGFRPAAALCYLACLPPAEPLPTGWSVEHLGADRTELFFDLLATSGVPFPPERRERKRRYYCTPEFQAFVARGADGQALGWATLFVHGRSAFLGNAYKIGRASCRERVS
jgi:hypothetical protein